MNSAQLLYLEFISKNDLLDIVHLIKEGSKQYFIQNFRPNNTFNPDLMGLNGFPPAVLEEFKRYSQ